MTKAREGGQDGAMAEKKSPGARRLQCLHSVQAFGTTSSVFAIGGKTTAGIDYTSEPRGVLVLSEDGSMFLIPWMNVASIELEKAK